MVKNKLQAIVLLLSLKRYHGNQVNMQEKIYIHIDYPHPQGADTKRMGEARKEEPGLGEEEAQQGPWGSLALAPCALGLERG